MFLIFIILWLLRGIWWWFRFIILCFAWLCVCIALFICWLCLQVHHAWREMHP